MAQKDEEKKPYVYTKHTYDPFDATNNAAISSANQNASNANTAYTNYINEGFKWDKQDDYNTVYGNYDTWLNTKFNYDFNADALYQQYKDKYIKQGKMAMQDTMGQVAALTGGYGNSYASTVGNQAYQASLENLNDVIPQLYQMAYSMHQDKGQNMLNQLGLLESDRSYKYGVWADKGSMLDSDRNYYSNEANNIYNREYTAHNDNEAMLYQAAQDAIAQEQWAAEHALNERQVALAENQFKYNTGEYKPATTGGTANTGGTGGTGGTGNTTPTSGNTDKIIKNLQNYSTSKGQADYLADEINAGRIGEEEAMKLLDEHGVVDLVDRSWEMTDDGGVNFLGIGIDADARVKDQYGNEYSLAELRKELKKTMTTKEANAWIKKLEKKLGI